MELRDYLRLLTRRRGTILVTTFVFIAAALIADSLRPPSFSASSTVLVGQSNAAAQLLGVGSGGQPVQPDREMQTASKLIMSTSTARRVITALKLNVPPGELLSRVTAIPIETSNLIQITASDPNPARAAAIANAFSDSFVGDQRAAQKSSIASVKQRLEEQQKAASDKLSKAKTATGAMTAEQQVLVESVSRLSEQLERLRTGSAIILAQTRVADRAQAPTTPAGFSGPVPTGLLGMALGLAAGVGLVFMTAQMDTRVRGSEDLADFPVRLVGGVPAERPGKGPALLTLREPASKGADAYRLMKLAYRSFVQPPAKVLLVASDEDSKTATLVAANLAVSLVQSGQRVALVDCDARRPALRSVLDLPAEVGLTDAIAGRPLPEVVQHPLSHSLAVIAAGPPVPSSAEMLCSQQMRGLVGELKAASDVVILCAPPLSSRAEAASLFDLANRLLLVVTAGQTRRESISSALALVANTVQDLPVDAVISGANAEKDSGLAAAPYLPSKAETSAKPEATLCDEGIGR